MCFSATASFSKSALLLGMRTFAVKATKHPREWPFAAIPLMFAFQQLIEGVIWLIFSVGAPLLNMAMTYAYSFISHVLWPVYMPVAVPDHDHCEPDVVLRSNGPVLRCTVATVAQCSLLFLCQVVHIGMVLFAALLRAIIYLHFA